jgi:hypothetical protein
MITLMMMVEMAFVEQQPLCAAEAVHSREAAALLHLTRKTCPH